MKDAITFGVILAAVTAATLAGITLIEDSKDSPAAEAASVEVRKERSEEAALARAKIEEEIGREKEKIEKRLREEFDRSFKDRIAEIEKLKAQASEQAETTDSKAEKIAELEQKIAKREEEARAREEALGKKESLVEDLEKRLKAGEEGVEKKQSELEALTQTLLRQQAEMKAADESRAMDDAALKRRESEIKDLAKKMEERQEQISKDQERLGEDQKKLSESQEKNREEWRKIEDAYKRAQEREAEIEKKIKESSLSAGEWEKIKEEWSRIEGEKKKLEEARAVEEDVQKYRETFDSGKYAAELAKAMKGVSQKTVESEFISWFFYRASAEEGKDQLRLFGVKDVYMNLKTRKYVVVGDYSSGSFESDGVWKDGELEARFPQYSSVVLERKRNELYSDTLAKALRTIGGTEQDAYVFGLMTKSMIYEVYIHQKKVIELLGLDRAKVVSFMFASFYHQGRWRFKVSSVTTADAGGRRTEKKVGNYSF